ncbi:MAG: DoxX family protein [Phenylobacterium sp.]|uniref:DoxX family protein n=1 Tax=Phenylobacterium sp. TaxID=1871053 RepID=UPI001225DCFB|nr:DoxX family protein [Phenylobacterium sp.]TAJ69998.1 MAG: DoxX family protein [Phenylobacterium sp.]
MSLSRAITLAPLATGSDAAFLALRLGTGAFLVWGVWDNITSAEHMATFAGFLRQHGFPAPEILAAFDVWLQFAIGVLFILGLGTRWAGLACAANFVIAIVMVDHLQGWRGAFGSQCLVGIGLVLATHGPGRFSVDDRL